MLFQRNCDTLIWNRYKTTWYNASFCEMNKTASLCICTTSNYCGEATFWNATICKLESSLTQHTQFLLLCGNHTVWMSRKQDNGGFSSWMTFFPVLFPHISRSIKPLAYKTFKCFFVSGLLHFRVILGSNQLDKLHSLFFVTIVHIKFHHHKPSWGPHLSKAQRTQGLSSAHQSNFFRLYRKFLHKSSRPSINFKISTKHQHFNQT